MTKNEGIISVIIIAIVALVTVGSYLFYGNSQVPTPTTTPIAQACTLEAKLCPDGSSVGRSGPNCEFTACPAVSVVNGWKTSTDAAQKVQFQYPDTLGTTYITPTDWPPKVQLLTQAFSCTQAGSETAPAGKTTQITINAKTYCQTLKSEGAAGSMYHQYAYATQRGDKTVILTFSLRFVQCANYPEPNMTACKNEQAAFNIDNTVDSIMSTFQFNQ